MLIRRSASSSAVPSSPRPDPVAFKSLGAIASRICSTTNVAAVASPLTGAATGTTTRHTVDVSSVDDWSSGRLLVTELPECSRGHPRRLHSDTFVSSCRERKTVMINNNNSFIRFLAANGWIKGKQKKTKIQTETTFKHAHPTSASGTES